MSQVGSSGRGMELKLSKSEELSERLHSVVPGGAHTYAKGDDQYPEHLRPVIRRGLGARVWDVDGNEYLEFGSGLRAVSLGHAHPRINAAVHQQIDDGQNFVRPAALELDAAESLLGFVGGDMVKFAKNGSDVTTAAVKLARARTGRDLVAVAAEHPFFSTDDWFIGSTVMRSGIPAAVRDLTLTFPYDDLGAVTDLFDRHPGRVACLVLEAANVIEPSAGYLPALRELCDLHGALLILDEMITGFRWANRGAQEVYAVRPHLATFGKAMANGFAVSALVGESDVMQLGGLRTEGQRVFLLSTTHGAESHSLAAMRAVIDIYREEGVIEQLYGLGDRLAAGVAAAALAAGVQEHVSTIGRACNLVYVTTDSDGMRSQQYRTLFLGELMRRGILAPSFAVSAALSDDDIDRTVEAVAEVCKIYADALSDGNVQQLAGRPVKPVFRQFV